MEQCTTCFKVNKDESLKVARDEAKKLAVERSIPMAIVLDGGEYFFVNAFVAYDQHLNVIEIVSHL